MEPVNVVHFLLTSSAPVASYSTPFSSSSVDNSPTEVRVSIEPCGRCADGTHGGRSWTLLH